MIKQFQDLENKKTEINRFIRENESYIWNHENSEKEEVKSIIKIMKKLNKILESEHKEVDSEIKLLQYKCDHVWKDNDPDCRSNFDS